MVLHPRAGQHRGRSVGVPDAERLASARDEGRGRIARRRTVGVRTVGVPRVGRLAGDADVALDPCDVREQLGGVERPVTAFSGLGAQPQIARVGARGERAPVQGRAAHAPAAVVGAEGGGVVAAAQALRHPVDLDGLGLVGREVVDVEVPPRFERHDRQPAPREFGRQRGSARARADHDDVDDVVGPVRAHPVEVHAASPVAIVPPDAGGFPVLASPEGQLDVAADRRAAARGEAVEPGARHARGVREPLPHEVDAGVFEPRREQVGIQGSAVRAVALDRGAEHGLALGRVGGPVRGEGVEPGAVGLGSGGSPSGRHPSPSPRASCASTRAATSIAGPSCGTTRSAISRSSVSCARSSTRGAYPRSSGTARRFRMPRTRSSTRSPAMSRAHSSGTTGPARTSSATNAAMASAASAGRSRGIMCPVSASVWKRARG